MKNKIGKLVTYTLLTATFIGAPIVSHAQDTNAPAATENAKHKKSTGLVFRGTVTAVDTKASMITVGKRTLEVTSETKITRHGEAATLNDITVGEAIGGTYKKSDDGKLTATVIHIGKKKE